jgi:hypothetical protein
MNPEEIHDIIKKYGNTFEGMDTGTRPKQAELARDGKIDELLARTKILNN